MESQTLSKEVDTEVLVIGAGPTGLAAATALAQKDVDVMIVDRLATGQNTSRAAVIHAHTLEVLDQIDAATRLVRNGLPIYKFSMRDRDQVLLRLQFEKLPTRYSQLLMIPQDVTERVLAQRLAECWVDVHRGWEVVGIDERQSSVVVDVNTPAGRRRIRARYVVGADGMHSLVRRKAGIGYAGGSYEESFVLADIDMTWNRRRDEVMLFFSPDGLLVVAPLPSGQFRIVATLDPAPEQPGIADVERLLVTRGPGAGEIRVTGVHWSSRFRLHHRLADHYRSGRLLLAGDAAHVHSPAGGQGMNTGLVDAVVLGDVLAEVVSGRREESYLDTYETLRRPAARQVMNLVGRLTGMATMKARGRRRLRNAVLKTLGKLPAARRKMQMNLSGLSRRRAAELNPT